MHLVLGNSRRWDLGPLIYSCSTSTSFQGSGPLANRSVQNILQERSCFKEAFGPHAECIRPFFLFEYDKWVSNESDKKQVHFPRAIKKSEQHLQVNGAIGRLFLLLSLCLVHFHFWQISRLAEAGLDWFATSISLHSLWQTVTICSRVGS